jgi:hypothetical protein
MRSVRLPIPERPPPYGFDRNAHVDALPGRPLELAVGRGT